MNCPKCGRETQRHTRWDNAGYCWGSYTCQSCGHVEHDRAMMTNFYAKLPPPQVFQGNWQSSPALLQWAKDDPSGWETLVKKSMVRPEDDKDTE